MLNKLAHLSLVLLLIIGLGAYIAYQNAWVDDSISLGVVALCTALMIGIGFLCSKQYREFEFEEIGLRRFPWDLRGYIKTHTAILEQLRFTLIGDFRLLPPPFPLFSRSFISEGGRCFAAIAGNNSVQVICFISVFDDGTYLESANVQPSKRRAGPNVPLRFSFLPAASAPELFAHHRDQVHKLEAENDTHVLTFTAEQYQEVSIYGHRLSGWDLHQQGERWTAPQGIGEDVPTDLVSDRIEPAPVGRS